MNKIIALLLVTSFYLPALRAQGDEELTADEVLSLRPILSQSIYNLFSGDNVGTAVAIKGDLALTACHNFSHETLQKSEVVAHWGVVARPAQLIGVETGRDVCAMQMTVAMAAGSSQILALDLAQQDLQVNDVVYALGNSKGRRSLSKGRVTAIYNMPFGKVYQTSSRFNPGASGGAILDKDYKLVGILAFIDSGSVDGIQSGYAVSVSQTDLNPVSRKAEINSRPFWTAEFK